MPVPFIFLIGTALAARSIKKSKEAKETIKLAEQIHEYNLEDFEEQRKKTVADVKKLEKKELEIIKGFEEFRNVFEKIHNRPEFKTIKIQGAQIPEYDPEELKSGAHTAELILGGATAVAAASFGLVGAGVALIIGGDIYSKKADKIWDQMKEAEEEIEKICEYLEELGKISRKYLRTLRNVEKVYKEHLLSLKQIILDNQKHDWDLFTEEEKLITENTVLLVSLLFKMCKVKLVLKSKDENSFNKINHKGITKSISDSKTALKEIKH